MGEVWRAFDLKLRVEVALKALREHLFQDERRRDLLRWEVRAAREVVSPNVCRIFDLV
jgi:serine/threonine-protein kinase